MKNLIPNKVNEILRSPQDDKWKVSNMQTIKEDHAMKNVKKKFFGLYMAMMIALAITLTGCGTSDPPTTCTIQNDGQPINLAIVTVEAENRPEPATDTLRPYIHDTVDSYGYLALYTCDANPRCVEYAAIERPEESVGASKEKSIHEGYTESVLDIIREDMKAKEPEIDVYAGMVKAYNALPSKKDNYNVLLVCDSMLSTSGDVDLSREDVLLDSLDIDAYVTSMENQGMICDMSKLSEVYIVNLGETADDQPALSIVEHDKLEALWSKILEKCNVSPEKVHFVTGPVIDESDHKSKDLPDVSIVTTVRRSVDVVKSSDQEDENDDIFDGGTVFAFDETSIMFKADSDEIITSEEELNKLLTPIADNMIANGTKVLIMGGTASGGTLKNTDGMLDLSSRRAEAVKKVLLGYGVSEDSIRTVGVGIGSTFYTRDVDENGNFVEEIGRKNRVVVLMSQESEKAIALLKEYS